MIFTLAGQHAKSQNKKSGWGNVKQYSRKPHLNSGSFNTAVKRPSVPSNYNDFLSRELKAEQAEL